MELIKDRLAQSLREAAEAAVKSGALPELGVLEIVIERPQNAGHGDFATNMAMRLARSARMAPLEIAKRLVAHMPKSAAIEAASVALPGFINITLSKPWLQEQVNLINGLGESFATVAKGNGERVQVEFVSANPTGPVHVGHGRGAVLGDALASVLQAAGYTVQREYYINDAGNQMQNFYKSLYARTAQAFGMDVKMPDDGYMGRYMVDLAEEIIAEAKDKKALEQQVREKPEEAQKELGAGGLKKMLAQIREDCEALGVRFDEWFSEASLFAKGQYAKVLDALRDSGYLAQREGATWFTSTSLGEDKDNVIIRSNGTPTYFATDIAYHYNKFAERGFDRVIDLWGADHQGHVPRMKAAVSALGIDPARLSILTSQLVTLKRGGEVVRISKRTGDIITLREVVDEVGKDAVRFFLLSRSADSQMDFDLEAAKTQSQENPVYYVQYAHARIAGILRLGAEKGIDYSKGDVALLKDEAELALIRKMLELPELIEKMAALMEPHHLAHYAQDLATAFHWFYKQCRVVSSEPGDEAITAARLKIVASAKVALAATLHLMGMTAPEKM
ncbi:MAG: arginine--tRNA ligase [Chloroflexi bacterium]|nr:arginine--tRNA ligase [Chloroflexota bacterium]